MKAFKLYKITVKGKVQGVFFRKNTQQKARELNLAGKVENRPDGTVYIEAQGDEMQLKSLVDWCKEGPPAATVEDVLVSEGETKEMDSFEIAH